MIDLAPHPTLDQRAEPRLDTPLGLHYSASFTLMGQVFTLPLHDFSHGGVGLCATPEQAKALNVGMKLEGVELALGNALAIGADVEVRLLRPFRTAPLGQQVRVGCRISKMTMRMRQGVDRALVTA